MSPEEASRLLDDAEGSALLAAADYCESVAGMMGATDPDNSNLHLAAAALTRLFYNRKDEQ